MGTGCSARWKSITTNFLPRNALPAMTPFLVRPAFSFVAALALAVPCVAADPLSFAEVVAEAQPKMVKVYGAGGLQGLETYQSGFLISATGHVLTTWSYVLDTDNDLVTVMLNDGRRFDAKVLGNDPRLEIAILKFDAKELPHFNLDQSVELSAGARVLAFSNLFNVATGNEPVSTPMSISNDMSAFS